MARKPEPFRVPAGVSPAIRRALRLKQPGTFLSAQKAFQLHDLLHQAEDRALREAYAKASAALDRSVRPATRAKNFAKLRDVNQSAHAIQHQLATLTQQAGIDPLPPLASRDTVPTIPAAKVPAPEYAVRGESAREIEIGVDYLEADGYRHRKDWTQDVSFNARIFRGDRQGMTERDARDAIRYFAEEGVMPFGVRVRTVTWENYRGDVTEGGSIDDLENFRAILLRVGNHGLRIGLVKPDAL